MNKYKGSVCIIGAGASGIVAAISAKRRGADVLLVDRMDRIGKKILACGAGRCNLLNERLDESFYNEAARALVGSVLARFGLPLIKDFFRDIGLAMHTEAGRVFPATGQSSSVLQVLSLQLKRLGIKVLTGFSVARIEGQTGGFIVRADNGGCVECKKIIVAAGGKSYPKLGSDGSGLRLAQSLGHSIIEPVPAAVPLITKDPLCQAVQGQRITAVVQAVIDGRVADRCEGDLLFTRYGVSGTAILDVSRQISVALHRRSGSKAVLVADLVPFKAADELKSEIARRRKQGFPPEAFLAGILPEKFDRPYRPLAAGVTPDALVSGLKEKRFQVSGTRGWNEAEFTAGGVSTGEIDHMTLESTRERGVYFCGEVIDVDGNRGGYNLAWAWASGFVAGLTQ